MSLRSVITAPVRGARSLTRMVFTRTVSWAFGFARLGGDYWREVGDGTGSSTVAAPLLWAARTFPEAPPALWRTPETGEDEPVRRHPMLRLLQRPNEFFTGHELWMATVLDYMASGDAMWVKLRSRAGQPVELWWAPSWMIDPKGDETTFITHYEYIVDGQPIALRPEDVVHFRFGIDSENHRRGMSPLKSVLREVYADDEAARFTASLLKNMGVPGLVVSPEVPAGMDGPSDTDVEATKEYFKTAFSGDKRGEPLVMKGPTKVAEFGFSPEQLTLRELRRIPEERVTAVTGIPAIVAGLGAGLDRSTFTNMAEARAAAYENGIIPMQRTLGEKVRFDLLTDFEPLEEILDSWRFGFDLSKVRVLQEDLYRQAQRLDLAVRGGWGIVREARKAMGWEVRDGDDIYLRQANLTQVPADGGEPVSLAPSKNGSRNGNGVAAHLTEQDVELAVERALERREAFVPSAD